MPSIAALVLPARRRNELGGLVGPVRVMMKAAWPGREVLGEDVHGRTSSVCFLRVGGDPFRSDASATVASGSVHVAQAGYLLADGRDYSTIDGNRGSVARTIAERGVRGLTAGDGVFAYASWNSESEEFVAAVDKLGMRPLYWCEIPGGGAAVASEIKTLLPLLRDLRVNWSAWEDQVRLGFQIGDHTLVQGINRFRRAGCLTWRDERITHTVLETFLEDAMEVPFRRDDFVERNHAAFMDSMRDLVQLIGEYPRLLTMSAGLDSRRILAGLVELECEAELLTVAMPHLPGIDDQMGIVRQLAEKVGYGVTRLGPASRGALRLARRARDAYTDFEVNEHLIYTLLAQAGVRKGINFDGMAGDTLLNPGRYLAEEFLGDEGDARFLASLDNSGGDWVRFPTDGEPFAERVRAEWERFRHSPSAITLMAIDSRARRGLALGPITIESRAFESTFPFLGREFMVSGLSLPPAERLRGQLQRQLTRRIDESIADIPSTRDRGFRSSSARASTRSLRRSRQNIFRALWRPGSQARVPLPQLGRFLGAAVLGTRIGGERHIWQWRKAEWIRRIREHEELVAREWSAYADFVRNAVAPVPGTVQESARETYSA